MKITNRMLINAFKKNENFEWDLKFREEAGYNSESISNLENEYEEWLDSEVS